MSEVIPGVRDAGPGLFELYGRVALTEKPERIETFVQPLKAWSSISVYRAAREYFVAVSDVITERKRDEALIQERSAELEASVKELEAFNDSIAHDLRAPCVTSTASSISSSSGRRGFSTRKASTASMWSRRAR